MRAAVGLGSNLDDPRRQLETAMSRLANSVGQVVLVSSLYETEPVGGPDQESFLNAVAVVDTDLSPRLLLEALQELEQLHRRTREVRWGPRTLDLDIIATDSDPISEPGLEVPHVRAHERRFVLEPLREVWPDVVLADGKSADLDRDITDQPVTLVEREWWPVPPT